jgi:hypothetical protein
LQESRGELVHSLVFDLNFDKSRSLGESACSLRVVPLAKSAPAVGVTLSVALIGRKAADQGRVQIFAPLLVIVQRLLNLR